MKKIRPNIVSLHVLHHYSPAIALIRCPFVLTSWGLEVLELPKACFPTRNLAKMTAKIARKIIVDAECLKEIWIKMGVSKSKIEVIPFGVDTDVFHPNKDTRARIRKDLRIKKSDITVISTRPFINTHYNLECLLQAIPIVVERHKNVKFILKGAGPHEHQLRRLVDALKVSKYVRFVGLTSHNDLAKCLAASDIYVSTSFKDSTSVSLLEAMACGLAPITTDIAGNREWIEIGRSGLLYPPKNHLALAHQIERLLMSALERKLYGETCLQIVRNKANWKECVERADQIFKALL